MPHNMSSQVIQHFSTHNIMSNIPPPSPTQASQAADPVDEWPDPRPVHRIHDGKVWALEVVQQPVRARMCGFGDKVCIFSSMVFHL